MSMTPNTTPPADNNEWQEPWLRRKSTIRLLWRVGIASLVVLLVLEFMGASKPYFGIDGFFGFYAWFGMLACVAAVFVARVVGVILKRPDGYYDD